MREIIFVCIGALVAGFVDAVAGGGGLIQIPALFIAYPNVMPAILLGTNKIPAFSGTALAAVQYTKRVVIKRKLVGWRILICAVSAIIGSHMVSVVNPTIVKPIMLVALICVAIYTYTNKNFGVHEKPIVSHKKHIILGCVIALCVGFYDGFLGPGSGNLLILGFVGLLGYDFLKASTHAKLLNLGSNFGSILLFGYTGAMIWHLVLPMVACNIAGSRIGTKMAFLKGNKFIRVVFICAITLAIVRYAWDVFHH